MGFLRDLFSKSSQKRDTTYTGPKPASTLVDTPGYKEYYPELVKRMGGEGVGYSGDYTKAPIALSRQKFEGYSVPELKSSISAMGMKGSPGAKHLTQAYAGQTAYESDLETNLMREAEQQRRSEINAAVSGLGQFGGAESGQANLAAQFEYNDHNRLLGEESARRAAQDKYTAQMMDYGAPMGASMLPGGSIASRLAQYRQTGSPTSPDNYIRGYSQYGIPRNAQELKYKLTT